MVQLFTARQFPFQVNMTTIFTLNIRTDWFELPCRPNPTACAALDHVLYNVSLFLEFLVTSIGRNMESTVSNVATWTDSSLRNNTVKRHSECEYLGYL